MNYTEKKAEMQGANPLKWRSTHYNCKPHARCKQIHKCEICHKIHATKQLHKHLNHITDKKLKKYKYAKYVTITPRQLVKDFEIHNSNIDYYRKELSNRSKQRYTAHPLHGSEYILFKEITRSKGNKELLPHLHMILLTNQKDPLFDNQLFDYDIRDIQIDLDPKYKNDYNNPLTQTIKKIFAYSTKVDPDRIRLEQISNISINKSDLVFSPLFKFTPKKSHTLIPIHIEIIINIRKQAREAKKHALKQHTEYKRKHGNINSLSVHKHALKTKKKLDKINDNKKILISRADRKLKRFSVRSKRVQT